MTKNHTPQTVAAALRDLADVLDLMTPATAGSQRVSQKAPEAAPTATKGAQKAPEGGKACLGCGKPMVHNPVCKGCTKKGVTADGIAPAAQEAPAPKVAAGIAPEAKANMGRREAKAHCSQVGCGLFVKAGATVCTKHTTKAVAKAQGSFITLDDGKRGYRVPADMVVALRKAGVDDATIIAAAQAKGLGNKAPKAKGTLV